MKRSFFVEKKCEWLYWKKYFLKNKMQELNKQLLQYLNSLLEYPIIESIVRVMADGPIFILPVFLLLSWFFYTYKKNIEKKHDLLHIFYATVLWIAISLLIQQFVNIDRPETAIAGTGKLILDHIPDASFPSDHATVSFAFLAWLYYFGFKTLFWYYLPLALIMNLCRVIAWVHWPLDILAWAGVGIFSAFIIYKYKAKKCIQKIDTFMLKFAWFFKL